MGGRSMIPPPHSSPTRGGGRSEAKALILLGIIGLSLGVLFGGPSFFRGYLLAHFFWNGLSVGCLGVLLMHRSSGGAWGDSLWPVFEAGASTLPWMGLLFLPILGGLRALYPWARDASAGNPAYLNAPSFIARSIVYFLAWSLLALGLLSGGPERTRTRRRHGGIGLVILVLTSTFASVDWLMSLEPHWASTGFGLVVICGHALAAFALAAPVGLGLGRSGDQLYRDLGNLTLTFLMLWAYLAFAQYLIIWAADLPKELTWYVRRRDGGWYGLGAALLGLHFLAPFVLLLNRPLKRARPLAAIGLLLLAGRLADAWWLIEPQFFSRPVLPLLDIGLCAALGAVWLGLFARRLARGGPVHA